MSAAALTRDLVLSHTRALKLPGVARTFERLAREARDQGWPHDDYLQEVLSAEIASRHESVLCQADGTPLTQKIVRAYVLRAARRAQVAKGGVHLLRHTFCSHLAMRGAPARAIQELAGHKDLSTTQRYRHLSPAAIEGAIRLLEAPSPGPQRGDIVETGK